MRYRVKFTLNHKLFIALFASSIFAVILTLVLMQLGIRHSFQSYLAEIELNRLDELVDILATHYQQTQSWQSLQDKPAGLRKLIRRSLAGSYYNQAKQFNGGREFRKHALLKRRLKNISNRLSLYDKDKNTILGQAYRQQVLRPIKINNSTIGWIALQSKQKFSDLPEIRFIEKQMYLLFYITLFVVLIAAGLSLLLARHLLKPIKALITAARALAKGKFASRINLQRSDELGQLANDFNHLALSLESNEQSRRQWVADISHELRTPLSILRGEIEAVQDGVRQADQTTIQSLHHEVLALNTLVEDLYTLALSDSGSLSYRKTPIDPIEILHQVCQSFHHKYSQKSIALRFDIAQQVSTTLSADADRLTQLFTNLLENSYRYTDTGGQVVIESHIKNNHLSIVINDSKPSVSTQDIATLFDRFSRVEASRSRTYGGAGLGLAICQNIVKAHHGDINASMSKLGGLCIQLQFPL